MKKVPGWKIEKDLWSQGYKYVAGIDEVGYGAWAGPVMAAAVVFDPERIVYGMRDSKKINSKSRLGLSGKVKKRSVAWSIGGGSVEEIYDNGLKVARELAFSRAIESLGVKPDYLIVDGLGYQWQDVPSMKIVGGDGISATIAAASIVAKVERDKLMRSLHCLYGRYGWNKNKGYGTKYHQLIIEEYGLTAWHRAGYKCFSKLAIDIN